MRLGYFLPSWSREPLPGAAELFALADDLRLDSLWSNEAYGSDALTPLAWWGSQTKHVRLGTAIAQLSARTPTATAMAAMTLDQLSGGRFVLGLGVSGPQVVEGWYGQPFPKPLERTREYVEVIRQVIARQNPVTYQGNQISLPYPGGTGLGKPLKSILHPYRTDLPIMIAAEGPGNVALAAEIGDGWFPFWFSPGSDAMYREALAKGFAREGARRSLDDFEVVCPVPVEIDDDVEVAADRIRPKLALYIGGMGAKGANFHLDVFVRMGYGELCDRVQAAYLAGDKSAAMAMLPTPMVEEVALIGPIDKIAEDLSRWRATCITTLVANCTPAALTALRPLFD